MNKASSLRDALSAAIPEIKRDPDKLLVFLNNGNVIARNTKDKPSFGYSAMIELMLLNFSGSVDQLFFTILTWVKENQPELIDNADLRKTAISFDVDVLNHKECDVSIKFNITETIKVIAGDGGTLQFEHVPEPKPEWVFHDLSGEA